MKRITSFLLAFIALVSLFTITGYYAHSAGQNFPIEKMTLKFAHADPTTAQVHLGVVKFAELVAEKTGGKVKIEIYPNSELGSEREIIEQIQMGTIEFSYPSAESLSAFVKESRLWSLPYLISGGDQLEQATKLVGKDFLDKTLRKYRLYGLGFFHGGFRDIVSKKEIRSIKDLNGVVMRVQEDALQLATWKALGTKPIPVSYSELYTALQTGMVDAFENQPTGVRANKFYEVTKYLVLSDHLYQVKPLITNAKFWDGLSPQLQKIIKESAAEAMRYQRKLLESAYNDDVAYLKGQGMEIIKVDQKPFKAAVAPVVDKTAKELGVADLVQKIRNLK